MLCKQGRTVQDERNSGRESAAQVGELHHSVENMLRAVPMKRPHCRIIAIYSTRKPSRTGQLGCTRAKGGCRSCKGSRLTYSNRMLMSRSSPSEQIG